MNNVHIFDIEANGLNATKLHCLTQYSYNTDKIRSTYNYNALREWLSDENKTLVGHNIYRYDIPTLERLLNIKVKCKLIDTLALSWYLFPKRTRHGLEEWGEEFGIPKVKIEDWEGLSKEEYINRCTEDVKINKSLWEKILNKLLKLYGNEEKAFKLINYLSFKMKCAADQEKYGWKLDKERCLSVKDKLERIKEEKTEALKKAMPMIEIKGIKKKPKKPYKQNGTLSKAGEEWFKLLDDNNLSNDTEQVEIVIKTEEPKPSSFVQLKAWLYSLGWKPDEFKYVRNKETNEFRKIEQIYKEDGDEKVLTDSVKLLIKKEPALEILEGLSILNHRISILKGFLNDIDDNGYIAARIQGFTNTLRFRHKVVLNLPKIHKPYGEDIRGCLICENNEILVGSDMVSLEDTTKRHYIFTYDPDYVREMSEPGYDPHLSLALSNNAITEEEYINYGEGKASHIKPIRTLYKTTNYACVYGASGATVARSAGIPTSQGESLVEAYWKKNWSVKEVARNQKIKKVEGDLWLYNPISKLWYYLKVEKDIFSTLNQGTGVYCFDTWLKYVNRGDIINIGQYHDEGIWRINVGKEDYAKKLINEAISLTNKELKLNIELSCDTQFGKNYAEIH